MSNELQNMFSIISAPEAGLPVGVVSAGVGAEAGLGLYGRELALCAPGIEL